MIRFRLSSRDSLFLIPLAACVWHWIRSQEVEQIHSVRENGVLRRGAVAVFAALKRFWAPVYFSSFETSLPCLYVSMLQWPNASPKTASISCLKQKIIWSQVKRPFWSMPVCKAPKKPISSTRTELRTGKPKHPEADRRTNIRP